MMQTIPNSGNNTPDQEEEGCIGIAIDRIDDQEEEQLQQPATSTSNSKEDCSASEPASLTETSERNSALGGMVGASGTVEIDTTRFPWRLHRMLTEIEKGDLGLEDIVSWQPHGRCFSIRDKQDFIETVMPKYFYQLKFVSFQRQMNLYGFKRVYGQGPDKGSYYHEQFLRGMTGLAGSIQRVKAVKGNSRKAKSDEPDIDFYAFPPIDVKAEQCLQDLSKALQEAQHKPKKTTGPKKTRRTSIKKSKSPSKKEMATPTAGINNAADFEPTPLLSSPGRPKRGGVLATQLIAQGNAINSKLPSAPFSNPLLEGGGAVIATDTLDEFFAPVQGPTSGMQHMQQFLQGQSHDILQQQGSSNSASLGASTFAGEHAGSSLSNLNFQGESEQISQPPSSAFGGTAMWDFEPTPLNPGVAPQAQVDSTDLLPSNGHLFAEAYMNNRHQRQLICQQQDQIGCDNLQFQGQQNLSIREQLWEQQRQQLLSSTANTEQSFLLIQQQHRLEQQQRLMAQVHGQQSMSQLHQSQQPFFPNPDPPGYLWELP